MAPDLVQIHKTPKIKYDEEANSTLLIVTIYKSEDRSFPDGGTHIFSKPGKCNGGIILREGTGPNSESFYIDLDTLTYLGEFKREKWSKLI
jgi:hypothetical protein